MVFKTMATPVGELRLVASSKGLAAVLWENDPPSRVRLPPVSRDDANSFLIEAETQLREYFAGQRTVFDVPLDFTGTEFQKSVWNELMSIPFGETRSYGELATKIGNPKASRAVGAANGKNPISIIAPCHRVIGASGALTGFAGGIEAKKRLLELEAKRV